MDRITNFAEEYLYWLSMPKVTVTDVLEIIILSFILYHIILWFKETRAWTLFKGIVSAALFVLIAYILQMNTILWIVERVVSVGLIALVVIFRPELRKALEQLGQKGVFSSVFSFDMNNTKEKFSDRTINELVRACYEMGKTKTGALIVIENNVSLREYEQTGIVVDALVSAPLLINIFEHNTPLHDGAVIMRGNRVVSATCYLPLTESTTLNKSLGTRHRAGVGVSEATDAMTIIVSEETGAVSIAKEGKLSHNVTPEYLREQLQHAQNKVVENKSKLRKWKEWTKHEKDAD